MSEGTAGQGASRLGFRGRSPRWEMEGFLTLAVMNWIVAMEDLMKHAAVFGRRW